ncbi:hypothetical protein L484_007518 [Morus notabilis]|uniref:Uncharacterized protein n=1 Tax=Morus notabilis TaxID=981085 RepID=W9SRM8_9ROSA|nr:hypothetical protein L484_007518 [Morus notabilis]
MRLLVVVALVVLMITMSSCSAVNVKTSAFPVVEMLRRDRRKLVVSDDGDQVQVGYPGSSVNNHHYIPRQDFNNHGGDDNSGNG